MLVLLSARHVESCLEDELLGPMPIVPCDIDRVKGPHAGPKPIPFIHVWMALRTLNMGRSKGCVEGSLSRYPGSQKCVALTRLPKGPETKRSLKKTCPLR